MGCVSFCGGGWMKYANRQKFFGTKSIRARICAHMCVYVKIALRDAGVIMCSGMCGRVMRRGCVARGTRARVTCARYEGRALEVVEVHFVFIFFSKYLVVRKKSSTFAPDFKNCYVKLS